MNEGTEVSKWGARTWKRNAGAWHRWGNVRLSDHSHTTIESVVSDRVIFSERGPLLHN